MEIRHILLATTFAALTAAPALGAPGDRDAAFGNDGVAVASVGSSSEARALAIQPDGKIVVAGFTDGPDRNALLLRYDSDGALDPTFGTGGTVVLAVGPDTDLFTGVVVQPDGKIVAVGTTNTREPIGSDWLLVRVGADGLLDPQLGNGGIVTTRFSGQFAEANDVALDHAGNIVVAGISAPGNSSFAFAAARYRTDGTLDPAFGTAGIVETDITAQPDLANDVAIDAAGRIVVAGTAGSGNGAALALVRYLPGGGLDAGFGSAGVVTTRVATISDSGNALLVQPDGKIVVVGMALQRFYPLCSPSLPGCINLPDNALSLVRYGDDGALDPAFGNGGVAVGEIGSGVDGANDVVRQHDGKLIVAGLTQTDFTQIALMVARYDASGALDPGFGTGGVVRTSVLAFDAGVLNAVRLQEDGKIVAAGMRGDISLSSGAALVARYLGDPAPDSTATATATASATPTATPTETPFRGYRVIACVPEFAGSESCLQDGLAVQLEPGAIRPRQATTFEDVPPGDYVLGVTPRCGALACWYDTPLAVDRDLTVRAVTASTCGGNCNGDCDVTVEELVRGVALSLSSGDVGECLAFDRNFDGTITVDELVRAVRNGLEGCPAETQPPACQ